MSNIGIFIKISSNKNISIYRKFSNKIYKYIYSSIINFIEDNNRSKKKIEYHVFNINKLLACETKYSTVLIISDTGLKDLSIIEKSIVANKFNNSKIISVLLLEKYKTIENCVYYLSKKTSLFNNSYHLSINTDELIKADSEISNIYIDNIESSISLIKELKKAFVNIKKIEIDNLNNGIYIFTNLPENYLLVQSLRVNGLKVLFTFADTLSKNTLGVIDNILTLKDFSNAINFNNNKLNNSDNINDLFQELIIQKK